jgi:hypothetical protein
LNGPSIQGIGNTSIVANDHMDMAVEEGIGIEESDRISETFISN